MKYGAAATEQLILALEKGNNGARTYAAVALGEIRDSASVDALIAATEDPYWDVRSQAARALGKIGDVRALPCLEKALANEGVVVSGEKHILRNRLTGEQRVVNDMSDTVRDNVKEAISALKRGERIPSNFGY
jgi:HEAT repeat protein